MSKRIVGLLVGPSISLLARPIAATEPLADAPDEHNWDQIGSFSGRTTLSIGGYVGAYDSGAREFGGMVMVTMPLSRLAMPNATRSAERVHLVAQAPQGAQPARVIAERDSALPTPTLRITPRLARACVRAAWRARGIGDDRHLDALISRARLSSLLPETRVRVARGYDESYRLTPTDYDPFRVQEASGERQWLEARLTWRFDRLLFVDEELRVEQLRVQQGGMRAKLAGEVLTTLFDWQRAVLVVSDETRGVEERLEAEMLRVEAEVKLDVMTAGWFAAWLLRLETAAAAPTR